MGRSFTRSNVYVKSTVKLTLIGREVLSSDSCSEGTGFELQHCLTDGHFSRYFVVKTIIVLFHKIKNKRREAEDG